jgi:two-component system chemotaxis response regulator CheB
VPGKVYVAPPNYHLCVGQTRIDLSTGPRENWFRPAIDPMFRSAAKAHGPSVIGILMTGMLYDGANGLWHIHQHGGQTIVQDPKDAEAPEMPLAALRVLNPTLLLPLRRIAEGIAYCLKMTPISEAAR